MPYVERNSSGVIVGLYANPQDGYAEEFIGDENAEVISFLSPLNYTDLSARQFWLEASRIGVTKADILALVDAMEDKDAAADLLIKVNEAASLSR